MKRMTNLILAACILTAVAANAQEISVKEIISKADAAAYYAGKDGARKLR